MSTKESSQTRSSERLSGVDNVGRRVLEAVTGPVVLSVIIAFAVGGVFMAMTGVNPLDGYASMFSGSFGSGIGWANTNSPAFYSCC